MLGTTSATVAITTSTLMDIEKPAFLSNKEVSDGRDVGLAAVDENT
jgi:hypothetical protein